MKKVMDLRSVASDIFRIQTEKDFARLSLQVFHYQFDQNKVYREFCSALGVIPSQVSHYREIPFMPVEFFRNHTVVCGDRFTSLLFQSSGTTGQQTSRHFIADPDLYKTSFLKCFRLFFGDPRSFHILALLPGYLERENSSLVYMVNELIAQSNSEHSGFYLHNQKELQHKIKGLQTDNRFVLLLGVSFALLDMAEKYPVRHPRLIVMETGGMKGKRKELVREELHDYLKAAFGVKEVCSEYGMTELLSQAYSLRNGLFSCPPWMKILIRDVNDPCEWAPFSRTGGLNVIDLANLYSCSFIATQDLGKLHEKGFFEISGRYDNSDLRGCNLMVG